jgi:hypothetical protein
MVTDAVRPTSVSDRIAATEKLYNEAELGASSDTVLRALDPIIERRLGHLLDQFALCAPELGSLLDLRAKITETWRIRKELLQTRDRGRKSWEVLQRILDEKKEGTHG